MYLSTCTLPCEFPRTRLLQCSLDDFVDLLLKECWFDANVQFKGVREIWNPYPIRKQSFFFLHFCPSIVLIILDTTSDPRLAPVGHVAYLCKCSIKLFNQYWTIFFCIKPPLDSTMHEQTGHVVVSQPMKRGRKCIKYNLIYLDCYTLYIQLLPKVWFSCCMKLLMMRWWVSLYRPSFWSLILLLCDGRLMSCFTACTSMSTSLIALVF